MDSDAWVENNDQSQKRVLVEKKASVLAGLAATTIVMTREGEMPLEWLIPGDEVLTRDRGFEPVIWINRVKLDRKDMRAFPEFAPIKIKAGSIEENVPETDITVSPHQLFLARSPRAELNFGSNEVLVPAAAIGSRTDTENMQWDTRVSYVQVLLASHQAILTDGLWVGSLFTGQLAVDLRAADCPLAAMLEVRDMKATRPILSEDEGRVLMHEIWHDRAARDLNDMDTAKAG